MTLSIGSLCSGVGGLDMAVELALGPVRHAWHAEVDPDASAVLSANWPGTPNLGDVTAVDFGTVPRVDVLTAGYPCQPFSAAGLRKGADDPRNRWPDVARAIRHLRPGLVVLENVRGHVRRGLPDVIADLAGLGYVGSWACVRASDVGAPHKRERVCVLAWPASTDPAQLRWAERWAEPAGAQGRSGAALSGAEAARATAGQLSLLPTPTVADSDRTSLTYLRGNPTLIGALLPTPTVNDSRNGRNATAGRSPGAQFNTGWTLSDVAYAERWGDYGPAVRRWEHIFGRFAPEPTVPGGKAGKQLSPLFVEWMMGLPEGHVTKHVERRTVALRLLGNGVVPLQLAHGIRSQLAALPRAVAA